MDDETNVIMNEIKTFLEYRILKGCKTVTPFSDHQKIYAFTYRLCCNVPLVNSSEHFIFKWFNQVYKSNMEQLRLLKPLSDVHRDYNFIHTILAYPIRSAKILRTPVDQILAKRHLRVIAFDKIKPFLMDYELLGDVSTILSTFFIQLTVHT